MFEVCVPATTVLMLITLFVPGVWQRNMAQLFFFLEVPFGAAALNLCLLDLASPSGCPSPDVRRGRGGNSTWGTIALVPLGGWSDQPRQRRRHLSALPLVSVTLRF